MPLPAYTRWQEVQLSELVELCSQPERLPIPGDTFEIFTKGIREQPRTKGDQTWKGLHLLARTGNARARLHTLISACALQGIPIRDLLLSPKEAASAPLKDTWKTYNPLEVQDGREHASKVLIHLFKALPNCGAMHLPPPFTVIEEIGVSHKELLPEARSACESYRLCYLERGSAEWIRKIGRAFKEAMQLSRTTQPNPFRRVPNATLDVMEALSLPRDTAFDVLRSVAKFRREIEIAKAKALGLSPSEFHTQAKLGCR